MTNKEILAELKISYENLRDIRENGCIDHCTGQMQDNIDKLELAKSYIEEYNEIFDRQELYGVNNIIYSLCKEKNKENPYYLGKGNGNIVENFIDKRSEVDYE